ncbi:acyl carrier protein [Flavobacterium cellulosilyticum]|uniref:Acyl carrier protein n=1 Tax=Flavobacterium cellulosilyticum TaxID=2541731 RepID=A0A4R5CH64_9FLAO|nr:acyl carrier protein [Flavobacterium cellulosilyticum]TDD98386.1 acyl carrier protein [Flavobacterium cellulosilyticum]
MIKQDFLLRLKEELELEATLEGSVELKELDEWDSMVTMVLIGFVSNEFDVILNPDDIKEMTTIDSLMSRIGMEKFN